VGQFLVNTLCYIQNKNYGTRFTRDFSKAKASKFAPFGMLYIFRYDAKGSL